MAKTVFDVLFEKLEATKASATEFLESGGPKDFAEYKETCGLIRGLRTAQREITDLSREYIEGDDD